MSAIVALLAFVGVFMGYALVAFFLIRRQKANRQLKPPEDFVLLRGPGETLMWNVDLLQEQMMDWLVNGSLAALTLLLVPLSIHMLYPSAMVSILTISGLVLFFASTIYVLRRVIVIGTRRANERQGYLGERLIGEKLQRVAEKGYQLFHDVPITFYGGVANIDHVAVGPHGAVVIETKTYSKPTNHKSGPLHAVFDGERIKWPRYADDTKTIWQVKKNSEWLAEYIRQQCNLTIQVAQVVAIPGWSVTEQKLTEPRVVSGNGVATRLSRRSKRTDRRSSRQAKFGTLHRHWIGSAAT